ncbi:hypothetical protein AB0D78_28280 [Streptomyces avermitilis]|uniref:hypothetical protein n=1 Tax=Streptomyces avermitilis TaxID=33903 RepID=UPI0033C6E8CF
MRYILWSLVAAYLLVVGLWPAAATPVVLTLSGATVLLGQIPGAVLLAAGVIAWLRRGHARPATA